MKILHKKLLTCIAVLGLSAGFSAPAFAGWPVIDAANLAQAIQEVISWGQQLEGMMQQYNQAVNTYRSLTGPRGMQNLLPIAMVTRNYLPPDYPTLLGVMNGTSSSYPLLSGQVQSTIRANALLGPAQMSGVSPAAQASLSAARTNAATLSMLSQQTQANASNNFGNVQQLIAQLGSTQDTKASADLAGRIQSEQVATMNNQTKSEALYQTIAAQELVRQVQVQESVVLSLGSFNTRYHPPLTW